jgi:hypothetical protein
MAKRTIFFAAYSVIAKKTNGEYQPKDVKKSIFWFSPQVIYPDGIAKCKKLVLNISRLGIFKSLAKSMESSLVNFTHFIPMLVV